MGEDTLVVQRMHRFSLRRGAFSEVIVAPLILPPNYTFGYEKWKKAIIQTQLKHGYQFTDERTIYLEGQEGYCFAFSATQNTQRRWITCDVPELHLSVGFIGDQTYASALDPIIEGIRRANSVRTRQGHNYRYDAKMWAAEWYALATQTYDNP